ncbi:MAG: hypothetical protein ACTHW7_09800 [Actinomycetaceae bacterium]
MPNEDTTTDGEQEQTATAASTASTTDDQDEQLGEAGKKALVAEREARKAAEKRAADNEMRIREIETAQMSDLEKAQQDAQDWQQKAEAATVTALRFQVASKHGISPDDADVFLTGTTEEEMTAQATRLAALTTSTGPTGPKPDRTQGGQGTVPEQSTADKFAATFEGRL